MDVIFVSIHCFELNLRIMLVDSLNSSHDEGLNPCVDNLSSVFGRKDYMVVTEKHTVRLMTIDSWHYSLMITERSMQE